MPNELLKMKPSKNENVDPVLKWIEEKYEDEIIHLFNQTVNHKDLDKDVYDIIEKHFLGTLVRLHREGEGHPIPG